MEKLRLFDLPPGFATFAGYRILGPREIISNKMYASMAEMANCILLRAPHREVEYRVKKGKDSFGTETENVAVQLETTDWRSYPTTDGMAFSEAIGLMNRKLGVAAELNAIGPDQKFNTTMSNLAEMIRPMYRGSILVVGTNLKPYDIVYIQDPENDLRGHCEVASVTHHFSAETGWVTEVEPHALVRTNNPTSEAQMGAFVAYAKELYGFDDLIADAIDFGVFILMMTALFGIKIPIPGGKGVTRTLGGALGRTAAKMGRGVGNGAKRFAKSYMDEALVNFFNNYGTRGLNFATARAWRVGLKRAMGHNGRKAMASKASAWLSYMGRWALSAKGIGTLITLKAGSTAKNVYDGLYIKSALAGSKMPMSVYLLKYRGANFQAGLEVGQEDIFSVSQIINGMLSDMHGDIERALVGLADDLSGRTGRGGAVSQVAKMTEGRPRQ